MKQSISMNQATNTEKLERRLANVERLLTKLLAKQESEWISEEEAMKILGRSKAWLKHQRLGLNGIKPALEFGEDWKKMNGRTPIYKRVSIENKYK